MLVGITQHGPTAVCRPYVMSSATRLIYSSLRFNHSTALSRQRQLHWLKAKERIDFKVSVLIYKSQQGTAPPYLSDDFRCSADIQGWGRLRSSFSSQLDAGRPSNLPLNHRSLDLASSTSPLLFRRLAFSLLFQGYEQHFSVTVVSSNSLTSRTGRNGKKYMDLVVALKEPLFIL